MPDTAWPIHGHPPS